MILFFVDGLRADVLDDLDRRGELPRLRRYFLDRAARVRSAVTSVPSVTYANTVTMMTGFWPSTHSVWANVWFDRQQLLTRNYEDERENADVDRSCPTIFDWMSSDLTAEVALPFRRAVKISLAGSPKEPGMAVWFAWAMKQQEEADVRLSEQLYEIEEQAREIGAWPSFIAIHLPAVDHIGHEHGSDGAEYRKAVANLDEAIGEVLEAFAQGGMLEELTIVLLSDHGHHSAPHSLALDEYLRTMVDVPVLLTRKNNGDTPFLARWEHFSPARVIVTTTGEREASIHLRTGESWDERPSLEQILAFPSDPGGYAGEALPERLLHSPAIDLVVVRAGENEVHVHGRGGVAAIERTDGPSEPLFRYRIITGKDPLAYDCEDTLREWTETGAAHSSREWLAATADQRHPDLVPQLVIAFDHRRSGDLILFAAPTWDFSKDYLGGHGGVEREEMIVPLYFAGPGIRSGVEVPAARLIDIAPTLLELGGVELPPTQHFDGQSLAPLLR
jgi:predicted AlkP superfamily pyrophosphatase or phosphodiesterase